MTLPVAAIFGHPVVQSRSPLVHGHWLKTLGIDGAYVRRDVAPEAFPAAIRRLAADGLVGGNVTIPHKEAAFVAADHVTEAARALGAVNTLWLDGGALYADNTDLHGFLANLDEGAPGWDADPTTALVLGAGGAARAIVHGLLSRGFGRVVVANRTLSRAETLATLFGVRVTPIGLGETGRFVAESSLIVNTTSLGMKGEGALPADLARAPGHAVVTDAVYVPLVTPFLEAATARGLRTVGGLGMLLHQAVPGFARWFGTVPIVTAELRALIEADVRGA